MKNVYMTLTLAAVIEFVSIFLPLKSNGALKKYVSYILSLVIILTVASGITRLFGIGELMGKDLFNGKGEYAPDLQSYLFVDTSGAYPADVDGNKTDDTTVFCDMYIKEACLEIAKGIKSELHNKFGIRDDELAVGVSVDISEPQNIKLTRVTIYTSLPDVAKRDLVKYTKELTGVKAVTGLWEE